MSGSGILDATSCTNARRCSGLHPLHVVAQADRLQVRLQIALGQRRRLLVQPRLHLDEPGRFQPRGRGLRRGEMLPPAEVLVDLAQRRLDRGDVAGAPALCRQLSAGPQDGRQVREQRVVVGDPVEGRRRQDRVHRRRHRQRFLQVGHQVLHPVVAEPSTRLLHHRDRTVQRHHRAAREPVAQHLRHLAGSAAGIQHALVAPEVQPSQYRLAPRRHGDRQAVVAGGVPISRHHRKATGSPARPGPTAEPQGRYCCSIFTIWPPLTVIHHGACAK